MKNMTITVMKMKDRRVEQVRIVLEAEVMEPCAASILKPRTKVPLQCPAQSPCKKQIENSLPSCYNENNKI